MFTVEKGTPITLELALQAVEYNETERARLELLDGYYSEKHDIVNREKTANHKNNKIVVNHAKYITNVNVGYLLGNPVDYVVSDKNSTVNIQPILDAYKQQNIKRLDVKLAKACSKMGRGYEYSYIVGNMPKSCMVKPTNAVVAYDDTVEHRKMFGVMYTPNTDEKKKGKIKTLQILTTKDITTYKANVDGNLILADAPMQHYFGLVPLTMYENNEELEGDYESVITLINGYNILTSDRVNDKEQLVEAILALTGFGLTKEQMQDLRLYRILANIPKEGGKAEYLTKMLNEADIQVLADCMEKMIHKISMTPNLADENFVGNASGVAIKYKLLVFEQNIINKEQAFEQGLLERFELYNNYLAKLKKMPIVPTYQIDAIFKRNLPQNDYETSQMIVNLDGKVDDETLIANLSFVKDPKETIAKARKEAEARAKMAVPNFGTMTPNNQPMQEQMQTQDEDTTAE